MSRLLVVTRNALVPGFHLAGVEAFGVADKDEAQSLISGLIEERESCLLAVDYDIMASFEPGFTRHLDAAQDIYVVPIPGGILLRQSAFRQQYIVEMIRRAVGIHITFRVQDDNGG